MAVAISHNFITIRQGQQILKKQEERPDLNFEQAACEFGILSIEQCQKIAAAQEVSRRSVEKIAVETGVCSQEQVDDLTYRSSQMKLGTPPSNLRKPEFSRRKSPRNADIKT